MESFVYSAHPSHDDSNSNRVQSHPQSPTLLPSPRSDSSLCPAPPSPALSQTSPFRGSALNPPLTLPPVLDGQHAYHQDELVHSPDMYCDILQPSEPPLSPPVALPSSILHLLIDLDARSLPLTHSLSERPSHLDDVQSLLGPSHNAQDGDTSFYRPSPLPAENWLDMGPMSLTERDPFEWEDCIKPPQPLQTDRRGSWQSPEFPPPIEELDEMDFDPSAPSFSRSSTVSLWSLESLPDERESDPSPRWTDADGSWTTSPDCRDGDLLHFPPIPPSFSYPCYDYKAPPYNHWDDQGCLSPTGFSQEDGEELLRSPSSPRSPLVNIPDSTFHDDDDDDDDDDYDMSALLSTPNCRKSLPKLEDDYGHSLRRLAY